MVSHGQYNFLHLICLCAFHTHVYKANGTSLPSQNPLQYDDRCFWVARGGNMSSAADTCADLDGSVLTLNNTETGTVILNNLGIAGSPVYVTIDSGWLALNEGWSRDKESMKNRTCVKLLDGLLSVENCTTVMKVTICESSDLAYCGSDLGHATNHEASKQHTLLSTINKTTITPKVQPLATIARSTTTKIATLTTTESTESRATPTPTTPKGTSASTIAIIATSTKTESKAVSTTIAPKAPSTATSSRGTSTTTKTRGTSSSTASRGTSTTPASRGAPTTPASRGASTTPASRGTSTTPASRGTSTTPASRGTSTTTTARGTSSSTASRGTSTTRASRGTSTTTTARGAPTTIATRGTSTTIATRGTSSSTASRGTSTTPASRGAPTTIATRGTSTTTASRETSSSTASRGASTTPASRGASTTPASRGEPTTTASRGAPITTASRRTPTSSATEATSNHDELNDVIMQPNSETKQGVVPFNDMPLESSNITATNENSTAATTHHIFSKASQVDSLGPVPFFTIATTSTTMKTPVINPFEILQIPSANGIRNVSLDNFFSEILGRSNISEASHTTIKPVPPCNVTIAAPDSLRNPSHTNQTSNHGGPPVTDVKFQVSGMNNGSVKPWTGGNAQLPQTGSHVTSSKTHNISKVLNVFKQLEHVDNTTLQEFADTLNFVEKDIHIAEETDDVKTMILEEILDVGEYLIAKIPVSMQTVVMTTDEMGLVSKMVSPEKDDNKSMVDFRSEHQTTNIQLSKKIFDSRVSTGVRVSAMTYRKMDKLNKASNKYISSNVVSVTVHYVSDNISETGVIKVDNAIFFEMETDVDEKKHEDRRLCTFWDFKQREWSTVGCDVTGKNDTHTSCLCNHLTSFAILVMYMETEDISAQSEQALFTMTTVGCSLSIACLVMTLICYIYLRILPNEKIMIHANLSLALLMAQIVFVSSSDAHKDPTACKVVAVLLHFLFLASFTWMMVEGIALYLCCTKGIFQHRDMRNLYFLLGWGLPLLIVVISLAARFPNYGTGPQYSCWLSVKDGLIWAFLGPMLIIVVMNIGVTGLVVKVFLTLRANADKTEVARLRGSLRAMLTLLPLLGVTWILSLLVPFSVVFHYFFVITNTVQGMCIFFLHCICNEEIRKKFYEKRRKWSTTRTGSDVDMTFPSRRKTGSFDAIRAAPPATQLPVEYATRTAWA